MLYSIVRRAMNCDYILELEYNYNVPTMVIIYNCFKWRKRNGCAYRFFISRDCKSY